MDLNPGTKSYYIYKCKGNAHKYIEVKYTRCRHYYVKQFISANGTAQHRRNYTGVSMKKVHTGSWKRISVKTLNEILEDYYQIVCIER